MNASITQCCWKCSTDTIAQSAPLLRLMPVLCCFVPQATCVRLKREELATNLKNEAHKLSRINESAATLTALPPGVYCCGCYCCCACALPIVPVLESFMFLKGVGDGCSCIGDARVIQDGARRGSFLLMSQSVCATQRLLNNADYNAHTNTIKLFITLLRLPPFFFPPQTRPWPPCWTRAVTSSLRRWTGRRARG